MTELHGDPLQRYVAHLERKVSRLERERDQARFAVRKLVDAMDGFSFVKANDQHHIARRVIALWDSTESLVECPQCPPGMARIDCPGHDPFALEDSCDADD